MIRRILLTVCALNLGAFTFARQNPDSVSTRGTLIINFTGMEENRGEVLAALFNSAESFNRTSPKFRKIIFKVSDSSAVWKIENLPFGVYAVKSYYDENSNNELDKNFLGIPTEKYGFSNNARGFFGPPGFDDAKFEFKSPKKEISIELK